MCSCIFYHAIEIKDKRVPLPFTKCSQNEKPDAFCVRKKKNSRPNGQEFYTGASDEARTRYLHLGKVALYQMSYTRSDRSYYSTCAKNVKWYF